MKQFSPRTVFAILMAAVLFFCFILVVELKKDLDIRLGWMIAGFGVTFLAGFILLYIRLTPVVILGTLGVFALAYVVYKFFNKGIGLSSGVGAVVAVLFLLLFQFGWMKGTGHSDYVKEQKAIFEKEQGGSQNYAQQQQTRYEQEKDRQGQGPDQI